MNDPLAMKNIRLCLHMQRIYTSPMFDLEKMTSFEDVWGR